MAERDFNIIGKGDNGLAQPTRPGQVYELRVHPSVQSVPAATIEIFAGMNASIKRNHERLKDVYAEHVDNSELGILQTADRALSRVPDGKRKTALILGAGNCLDIPLAETDKFDEVTLVEIDYKSTERAVKQLPLDLQKKTNIIAADITGFIGEFAGRIQPTTDFPLPEFLTKATEIAKQTDVKGKCPDLGSDYTFVSSQLVMTQLASIPHEYLQAVVSRKYGAGLSTLPGGAGLLMELKRIAADLQQEHVRQLARMVDPNGTVHLADTYAKVIPIPFSKEPQILPMVLPQLIDPTIAQHFISIPQEPDFWLWNNEPGKQQFFVQVHSLDPKK